MKKRKLLYFFTVILMGLALGIVSILGVKKLDTVLAEKNNISISENIAIVNQDEGIGEGDDYINYAEKIIETLDKKFIVTSREIAKKGMSNGTYSAMIIFPGTFSKNVISINNERPEKTQFYYETSSILSKEKKANVEKEILALERNTNDKLSYLYIANILNEFHRGQEKVEYVLKNDEEDLQSISSINDNDLIKAIDLRELEKLDIDIETLDLSKDFELNEEIMNQMDQNYKEFLAEGEADLNSIKNKGNDLIINEETGLLSYLKDIYSINILPPFLNIIQYTDIIESVKNDYDKLIDKESLSLKENQEINLNSLLNNAKDNNKNSEDSLNREINEISENMAIDLNLEDDYKPIVEVLKKMQEYINELSSENEDVAVVIPNILIDTVKDLENTKIFIDNEFIIVEATKEIDSIYKSIINKEIERANVLKEENKINALISEIAISLLRSRQTIDPLTLNQFISEEIKKKVLAGDINFEIVKSKVNLENDGSIVINNEDDYVNYLISGNISNQYEISKSYNDFEIELPNIEDVKVSDKYQFSILEEAIKNIENNLISNISNIDIKNNEAINNTISKFNEEHVNKYNNIKSNYDKQITDIKNYSTKIIDKLRNEFSSLMLQANEEIENKNISNKGLLDKLRESIGSAFSWLNGEAENLTNNTKNDLNDVTDEKVKALKEGNENNASNIRSNIRAVETETKMSLENSLIEKQQELATLQEEITKYNPIEYITKNQRIFDDMVSDYNENNINISEKIKEQDSKNIKFTEETYKRADEHVEQLKEDVLKTKEESEKLITDGLKDAKEIKQENSYDNKNYMEEFTKKLPYTRIGTLDNTYMYDFIATPMQGIDATIDDDLSTETTSNNNILEEYKVYIIASLIVILFVVIVRNKNKSRVRGDINE